MQASKIRGPQLGGILRNSAVFILCARPLNDDDCSVVYTVYFGDGVEKQPPRNNV